LLIDIIAVEDFKIMPLCILSAGLLLLFRHFPPVKESIEFILKIIEHLIGSLYLFNAASKDTIVERTL
jgi:hypothetical protein